MRHLILALVLGLGAGVGVRLFLVHREGMFASPPPVEEVQKKALEEAHEKEASSRPPPEPPANPLFVEKLYVRGWLRRGSQVNVVLSDGTVVTEEDPTMRGPSGVVGKEFPRLELVGRNFARIGGRVFALRPPTAAEALPPAGLAIGEAQRAVAPQQEQSSTSDFWLGGPPEAISQPATEGGAAHAGACAAGSSSSSKTTGSPVVFPLKPGFARHDL